MKLTYYPGCSLRGTSEEYDHSIQAVSRVLGLELIELDDWTCCGASSAHVLNDALANLLGAKVLGDADEAGRDVLVPCAACYSRLKFAEKAISQDPAKWSVNGRKTSIKVIHIHDLFSDKELLKRLKEKVTRPLRGLRAVPYYGCLTVRPPKVVDAAQYENPTALDEILKAIGAQPVAWSYKTDCCGGSFSISRPDVVRKLSGDLLKAARDAGGECIVTDCPMCQANLDSRQAEIEKEQNTKFDMPILFITELIALALGIGGVKKWLGKHLVDSRPLLSAKGLG